LKVLHILNTSSYSGAENVVISIIKGTSNSVESAYASLDGEIKNKLNREQINYIPLKKMSVFEVRKAIKKYNPDVIHAHDYTTSVIASISGVRIPIISHLHNNAPWIKTYHLKSFLYWYASLKFEKILCVSNSIINEFVFGKSIKFKSEVVSNPVSVSNVLAEIDNEEEFQKKYDLIYVGRLTDEKNPLKFIEIVNEISKKSSNLNVAIVGDGYLKSECQKKINDLGLDETVKMFGFLNNPYKVIANSKILCLTSKWEGYGLVAFEAMCLGVPVLAPRVGGLVNIVNKESGLLTNNDEEYLAEIFKLLKEKDYWNEKSSQALKRANEIENFNQYMYILKEEYFRLGVKK